MPRYRVANTTYLRILAAGRELFEEELSRYQADIKQLNEYFFYERERLALLQKYAREQRFRPIYLRLEIARQRYEDWPRAGLWWCIGSSRRCADGTRYWSSRRFPPSNPDGNYRAKDITAMVGRRGWYFELVRATEAQVQPIRRHIRGMQGIYKAIVKTPEFQDIQTRNYFSYVPDDF